MKTRLLKRLRREARYVYFIKSDYPFYNIIVRDFYRGEMYEKMKLTYPEAIMLMKNLRTLYISNEVKKLKKERIDKEMNKQLRKL